MKILVTGSAGFVGFYTVKKLISEGHEVVGLDNINDYYDVNLKYARLEDSGTEKDKIEYNVPVQSTKYDRYSFVKMNLEDRDGIESLFEKHKFDRVCHLAAQAGVRYSIENPHAYIDSNIIGFMNILESCRKYPVEHLVYASSSSVYGANKKIPFSVEDNVDNPVSLYAATKKSNELMAHTYSHLYNIPTTGLRFFTVYGPWGRPDMAYFKFTKSIVEGKTIDVYNNGDMMRDFTYIDDIVEGVCRIIDKVPETDAAPYKVYNIGNNNPVKLMDFISTIEKHLGKEAVKNFMPMQPGDVYATYADVDALIKDVGYKPDTDIDEGIGKFVEWFKGEYKVEG